MLDGYRTCPICGQMFLPLSYDWVYKKSKRVDGEPRMIFYCSWKCYREAERRFKDDQKRRYSDPET